MDKSKPMPIWLRAAYGVTAAVDVVWLAGTIPNMDATDEWDFHIMAAILALSGFWFAFGGVRMRA